MDARASEKHKFLQNSGMSYQDVGNWAKTFREAGSADIGYAAVCHEDYAACQAFNPKIKMIRTKTLMQGDGCCDHRLIWQDG